LPDATSAPKGAVKESFYRSAEALRHPKAPPKSAAAKVPPQKRNPKAQSNAKTKLSFVEACDLVFQE